MVSAEVGSFSTLTARAGTTGANGYARVIYRSSQDVFQLIDVAKTGKAQNHAILLKDRYLGSESRHTLL